jgi:hypothetical protein
MMGTMMSKVGQIYRNMSQQAMDMANPCFRIEVPHTNDLEEMARLYYTLAETVKKVGLKFDIGLNVELVDKHSVECRPSPIGTHEMKEINIEGLAEGVLMCIHCGRIVYKTKRSDKEISEYMKGRKFKRNKTMPLAPEDELPFY